MRLDFPDSVQTAALRRDCNTCQAPDCGRTPAARAFRAQVDALKLGIRWPGVLGQPRPLTLGFLADLAARVRAEYGRQKWAIDRLSRYRLLEGPDALLQVDHVVEAADGGKPVLENAQVLCICCHLDKTAARGNTRRKGPQLAQKLYGAERRAG